MTSAELNLQVVNPLLAEIDRWRDRMVSTPVEVQTGSRLKEDDDRQGSCRPLRWS